MAASAHAARPLTTDDARLTTAQSCQLESWLRYYPHSHEAWALPACNPTGNLEFSVGVGRAASDGQGATRDYAFQAKTLFRTLETNGWGWGLAAGTVSHPGSVVGPNRLGNTYAYAPVSASFNDDTVILHANLGWIRDRMSGSNAATWGLGAEIQASARIMVIAETFGDNHNNPYWQIGGRVSIVPNLIQIDATVGHQYSGPFGGRCFSVGLRLTPDRLF